MQSLRQGPARSRGRDAAAEAGRPARRRLCRRSSRPDAVPRSPPTDSRAAECCRLSSGHRLPSCPHCAHTLLTILASRRPAAVSLPSGGSPMPLGPALHAHTKLTFHAPFEPPGGTTRDDVGRWELSTPRAAPHHSGGAASLRSRTSSHPSRHGSPARTTAHATALHSALRTFIVSWRFSDQHFSIWFIVFQCVSMRFNVTDKNRYTGYTVQDLQPCVCCNFHSLTRPPRW